MYVVNDFKIVDARYLVKKAREVVSNEMTSSLMQELHLVHSPLNTSTPARDG